jgi:hypothetical protein
MQRAASSVTAVPLVSGLVAGLLAGLSCGSLEATELDVPSARPACALVTRQDVSEIFGAPVEEGQATTLSETSYCAFRFVGRDDRVVVSVTPQVQPFARHALVAGSSGEEVRGLGRRASWSENLLVVLQGSALYVSHGSSTWPADAALGDRDKHVELARRALLRLAE